MCETPPSGSGSGSLLVLYSNFIGVKWEKEVLVPRVGLGVVVFWAGEKGGGSFRLTCLYLTEWINVANKALVWGLGPPSVRKSSIIKVRVRLKALIQTV
jgi:hypothetical protein